MVRVLVLPGDGVGPEVVGAAVKVLKAASEKFGVHIELKYGDAGDAAQARHGVAVPEETWRLAEWADAILKGPVGETAKDVVVAMRLRYDLYANIRPAKSFSGVPHVAEIDCVIVRENTEDLYIGAEFKHGEWAVALKYVSRDKSRRIARTARKIAESRKRKVTIVHKSNVLPVTDGLFRDEAKAELAGLEVEEMYVDAAAMEFVRKPSRFDVVLTMNLYGDILSDLAAQVAGSLGMAPSANIGDRKALFEPVHGAAFDIAGKGIANPMGTILSIAMLFDWIGRADVGNAVRNAVEAAVAEGVTTPDIGGRSTTAEVGEYIARHLP